MNIPLVPDDHLPPPKKYNFKKKKSHYGHWKKQSSSTVFHHQGLDHHPSLASDFLLDALLPNQYPSQPPSKICADDNWRTTNVVISWDNIIQNEILETISIEEIIVQEMAKRVAVEDKAHGANDRRMHAKNKTQQEKHALNILIHDEKKKAHDIIEDAQFIMKDSHAKRRSHQRGVYLLMLSHKNERQLKKNNHEKVVSHFHTK